MCLTELPLSACTKVLAHLCQTVARRLANPVSECGCTNPNGLNGIAQQRMTQSVRNGAIKQRVLYAQLTLLLCACSLFSIRSQAAAYKVLVYSATAGFRHDCITNGIAAIQALGSTNGFTVDATEDATRFNDANLAQYKAVIFLCTTGDI